MEISSINEKEIIEILTDIINDEASIIDEIDYKALQGLLDLYNKEKLNSLNLSEQLNKEKEKNKELQNYMKQYLIPKSTIKLIYVSKEEIKEIIDKIDVEDYYCLNEAEEDLRKLVE